MRWEQTRTDPVSHPMRSCVEDGWNRTKPTVVLVSKKREEKQIEERRPGSGRNNRRPHVGTKEESEGWNEEEMSASRPTADRTPSEPRMSLLTSGRTWRFAAAIQAQAMAAKRCCRHPPTWQKPYRQDSTRFLHDSASPALASTDRQAPQRIGENSSKILFAYGPDVWSRWCPHSPSPWSVQRMRQVIHQTHHRQPLPAHRHRTSCASNLDQRVRVVQSSVFETALIHRPGGVSQRREASSLGATWTGKT